MGAVNVSGVAIQFSTSAVDVGYRTARRNRAERNPRGLTFTRAVASYGTRKRAKNGKVRTPVYYQDLNTSQGGFIRHFRRNKQFLGGFSCALCTIYLFICLIFGTFTPAPMRKRAQYRSYSPNRTRSDAFRGFGAVSPLPAVARCSRAVRSGKAPARRPSLCLSPSPYPTACALPHPLPACRPSVVPLPPLALPAVRLSPPSAGCRTPSEYPRKTPEKGQFSFFKKPPLIIDFFVHFLNISRHIAQSGCPFFGVLFVQTLQKSPFRHTPKTPEKRGNSL